MRRAGTGPGARPCSWLGHWDRPWGQALPSQPHGDPHSPQPIWCTDTELGQRNRIPLKIM